MRITMIISALLLSFALVGCASLEVRDYSSESENISATADVNKLFHDIYEQDKPCSSHSQTKGDSC
ncbi:MAG: hypothetical protein HY807_00385 [Nitrospirae bacterium]|nr:hypothetical protein [Nitrospirota bacterium]